MNVLISAAAPQSAGIAIPGPVAAAIMALFAAAVLVVVLKIIGKVLSPKKKSSRPSSGPYGTGRR
jgi:hypothetical protein